MRQKEAYKEKHRNVVSEPKNLDNWWSTRGIQSCKEDKYSLIWDSERERCKRDFKEVKALYC